MIWLSWRQQRIESLIILALLAVLAVAFVPAGMHAADLFTRENLGVCAGRWDTTEVCYLAIGDFANRAGFVRSILEGGWLNLIPGLIGAALAAPLLLDLDNGTTRLAWTQSVTRRRWIATRLGVAVGTALVAGAAFGLLFTWYQRPFDRIWGRWDEFGFEGIVPLAYVLFALGLALAIGVLLRRSAAALVVAFGAYVAARLFVQSWLRQRFVTPLAATWRDPHQGPNLSNAWVLREGPSTRAGHLLAGSPRILHQCASGGQTKSINQSCLARLGYGFNHAVYQPASRFWEFQAIEFALFGGLAALLIAFAAWRVLRAD